MKILELLLRDENNETMQASKIHRVISLRLILLLVSLETKTVETFRFSCLKEKVAPSLQHHNVLIWFLSAKLHQIVLGILCIL